MSTHASMPAGRPVGRLELSTGSLLGVLGLLALGSVLVQVAGATLDQGRPALGTLVALLVVAAALAVFTLRRRVELTQRPYGFAVVHAFSYLAIVLGFQAHALVRALLGSGVELDAWGWALIVLPLGWGTGLVVHLVGAVLARGHEYADL